MRKVLMITLALLMIMSLKAYAIHWLDMDFDKDGDIDASDLATFASYYGRQCDDEVVVWQGDYSIETLEDMDNLRGYSEVTGNLSISYTSLTNLKGLVCLTVVGGNLEIESNHALTSLEGLENLTSVAGDLEISDSLWLMNLEGLNNLTSIGGNLVITAHVRMESLEGLENLASVGWSLAIAGNHALSSLHGLNIFCVGNFNVSHNVKLCQTDVDALYNSISQFCESIGSGLPIYNSGGNDNC